ncbi:GntR family transcriptional regulator [Micromonospora radicis]|uniref:GntR family transcriptional regulator n=1 Tax=Micromonospora radicis TaxID=1894971 RepID=UPI001F38E112|nr:GntR family transcriptional regulator [Micromonospora radicis]
MPLYAQLGDILRERIASGEWAPGSKIPSENELNTMYGLSRMTVRQVLNRLVDEDLLYRVQGKGTFVAHRKISTRSPAYLGIREQLEQQGYATRTVVLGIDVVEPPQSVAERLDLPVTDRVVRIRRLRFVDDQPISLHESYIPEQRARDLVTAELSERQLCVVLEEDFGLAMSFIAETLVSVPAPRAEAAQLDVSPGAPLLLLEQTISSADRRPFELARIYFRGDRIRLEFQYER